MPVKIGHFEIQSELSKSPTSVVYKATDPESAQTVALKAIQLAKFGEHAATLTKCLQEEVEQSRSLKSQNVATIFGAGEMDGQFCAATEYIEGNSVATMLARKEGFSIWDLLDIGRQVCSGLDLAHAQSVFHYSFEPSKIMCGWDGTVRILGMGVSSAGNFTEIMAEPPAFLPYMSPEQIGGEPADARSNLFSLGAILYEMVTEQAAFGGDDAGSIRRCILEDTPAAPIAVNAKVHPQLSALILKALAKDPQQRYQSGRELLDDLEKCKESNSAAAVPTPKPAAPAKPAVAPRSPAQASPKSVAAAPPPAVPEVSQPQPPSPPLKRAVAAASSAGSASPQASAIIEFEPLLGEPAASSSSPSAPRMSAAPAAAPDRARPSNPKVAVDPMMAEVASSSSPMTFSEISELPPLKEVFTAPPPAASMPVSTPVLVLDATEDKPRIQPREVAEKAMREIKNVPPRLMIYAIAGAVALILVIAVGMALYVHQTNSDDDSSSRPAPQSSAAASSPAQAPMQAAPVPQPEPAPIVVEALPASPRPSARKKVSKPAPVVVVPGQMAVDSTPEGAQVQVDGSTNPGWITPYTLAGLQPGQHTVTVSKPGFATDTRTIDIAAGSKSFVAIHLAALTATLSASSNPAGASIFVDGKDSGKLTPAQLSLDKGQHNILVRKAGFIDESSTSGFVAGQTVAFSPSLRALGNVDDLKTVGKLKKMFGNGGQAGMGAVSIHTQPKGAQVAVNQHLIEKFSPVEIMLDPGNYVLDITLTGFAPVHKVITVDKGGKVVVDETLTRQ